MNLSRSSVTKPHVSEDDPNIPPALNHALERQFQSQISVPPDFDETALASARLTLVHRRWRRRTLRFAGAGAALAAAAAVLIAIRVHPTPGPQTTTSHPQIALRNDLDGNGKIDILDAFQLARALERHDSTTTRDINGDGMIDQRDVDTLAQAAVSMEGRS